MGGCSTRSARPTQPPAASTAAPGWDWRSQSGWPRRWAAPCGSRAPASGAGQHLPFHDRHQRGGRSDCRQWVGPRVGQARSRSRARREPPAADPLVEDNAVNQKLAIRLLGRMGHEADVAGDGREAIEAIGRQRYDVVLMDVQMPEMDGLRPHANRRAGAARAPAVDRGDDGERHGRRPRALHRGRHGRLHLETDQGRRAGRRPVRHPDYGEAGPLGLWRRPTPRAVLDVAYHACAPLAARSLPHTQRPAPRGAS